MILSKLKIFLILTAFLLLLLQTATPSQAAVPAMTIKIMTLNLHNGKDATQQPNFTRLNRLITAEQPDIVALQEVQPKQLKQIHVPGYHMVCGPNANFGFFRFGNALLTRHRIIYHRHHYLPSQKEQRGVDEVALEIHGQNVRVLNTHLGLGHEEQKRQIRELIRINSYLPGPILLTGDFNLEPFHRLLERFTFQEVSMGMASFYKTYPTWNPIHHIDHIWYSPHFMPLWAQPVAWDGSDHLPVIAALKLVEPGQYTDKPVAIPDPTSTNNPLLPDIGVHPLHLQATLITEDSRLKIDSGFINIPLLPQLGFKTGYYREDAELALIYHLIIDLRDYFSLAGIRNKAEWNFAFVGNNKGDYWLEWEQYYRWNHRWGSKLTVAGGDKPEVAFEQSYLPTENIRVTVGFDTESHWQAGLAYTPDQRQVWQVSYDKDELAKSIKLGWEYRF